MTDTQMTTSIDVGPASATGHLRSPLFVLLPVELRLKIYEDVFDGANAKLVCRRWYGAPNHDETHDYPDYLYVLRQSEHHRPLLTCRALYEEAMTLYWSHTVIHMPKGTPRDIWQRGYKYPSIGDAVFAIPVHARQYIQHITNVKDCQGYNVKERGGPWWLAKGLSYLPSLKTCRLADVIQTDSNFHDYSPYIIGFRLAGDVWGPSRYEPYIDSDDYFIDYCRRQAYFCRDSHPVVFEEPYFAAVVIQKYRIRHADPEAIKRDPDAGERREPGTPIDLAWPLLVQEGFINHTTQRIYHTIVDSKVVNPSESLSDDCAFQRAIGDPSLVPMWPLETPFRYRPYGVSLPERSRGCPPRRVSS